ncbi:peptidoglycan DD-metalloendopeptidase family protein [Hymenobacter psychrophilus]|uniref:Murein DD-endopeptidase MepM and murein hydrolase activator NlpD, contain LysM domain n=1 Tax=Hymenobacter psychrophilus TaxID=651662 RepID=A0A1H3CTH4_9BACT|nr:peptidoglycan DD-metalloendopeptidase family protein [Hymenobacter psychrophilus]SDX57396.1 Murein DD-endopeptidase MepM and murein hydrolase activator NlpD, contain LysM domain [Hymenobacter psychrophilus]
MPHRLRALPLPLLLLLALLSACSQTQTLRGLFQQTTPHETYARRLQQAGLAETALGRDWLRAADQALRDSLTVQLPYQESGFFPADRAVALGLRYGVRAGEAIRVSLTLAPGTSPPRVFLDAFELRPDQPAPRPLLSADTASLSFRYVVETDRQHLLRVQPELLRGGRYTLSIRREPSLSFPVLGKSDKAIGSFWGAGRDGGARRHEGVDIFAPRGTPAVAAAPGVVTRVQETPLGGRVVWLATADFNAHLYYAHLDKQLVQPGQRVRTGDTLGLVGNTGNARTTPPHLHFGVYRNGALDPLPFVRRADAPAAAPKKLPAEPGQYVRMQATRLPLRRAPGATAAVVATLSRPATPLQVLGAVPGWLRVQLPEGGSGFVAAPTVRAAAPLRREKLATETELHSFPRLDAPSVAALPAQTAVAVLGEFGKYRLVRQNNGRTGWVL